MTTNDIDAIRQLTDAATDGPWFYNSYSAVLSGPKVQPHDEWLDTTGEHSLERHGNCEACGPDRRGCLLFSEDYKRDPIVAHVPAHHGDTAVGERVADAEFIAAARTLVPALCDEIEQLRAEREHTELNPTGTAEWLKNRVNELAGELAQMQESARYYSALVGERNEQIANVRRLCDEYKDHPPPLFQGPGLSERGEGYNAGTRDMARAVLGTIDGAEAVES